MKFASLRKECYEANMELPKLGLVIYTFGNVSCIDRKAGVFAIKPSGVDYDKLTPEDIVIVGLDGKIVDGKLRPSSDTNTHLELYKAFPSVGGIVHAGRPRRAPVRHDPCGPPRRRHPLHGVHGR